MKKYFNYLGTYFLFSVPNIRLLPVNNGIEIAFVGRSNSGKSSAINTLTSNKSLAKTSKTPGRTQLINFFEVEPGLRIVDLPGYGYAKVPENIKRQWQHTISEYLQRRDNLKGLVVLMDIRHPMKYLDQKIIILAKNLNIPILILLTKSDKLTYKARNDQLNKVRKMTIPLFKGDIHIEIFSSIKKHGVETLRQKLNTWFSIKCTILQK
ncbi:Probable GTP-binding protein EngB [secondary endosymbiont of Trabutina mannipara]|uniref:Probable GTP-binding protein EngB n=1 Tax=secondary endosymbiont of Trabutina mannipara TaxID=1835721 RepID=A0A1C3L495_9ENTR|nr:ribosome biogenesis GTP-binding protein YihA/YsxC [secondary endosymbiont of Trabutina mannipara]SBT82085.1 Probable GTP-binding protein EngB [secondary endosymbiont of Trabutina mannipara]